MNPRLLATAQPVKPDEPRRLIQIAALVAALMAANQIETGAKK